MGTTTKYAFPWPAATALVKDGAAAIQSLAEGVEAALLPPLLCTDGGGSPGWSSKVAEVAWDVTDSPDRKRGSWSSVTGQLVVPALTGWYFVSASIRFGGKSEADFYEARINTREGGSAAGSGTMWAMTRLNQPDSSTTFTQLSVSGIVQIPASTPNPTGIAIRLQYDGSTTPPAVAGNVNKIRIYRLSAL